MARLKTFENIFGFIRGNFVAPFWGGLTSFPFCKMLCISFNIALPLL
jgi:hypothetical protein